MSDFLARLKQECICLWCKRREINGDRGPICVLYVVLDLAMGSAGVQFQGGRHFGYLWSARGITREFVEMLAEMHETILENRWNLKIAM
jgi:hypothetical protein